MASHDSTPDSVLEAPVPTFSYVQDKDGKPIKHEGANRAMLRAAGIGVEGWTKPSMSAMKQPEHPIVTERKAKQRAAAQAYIAEKQEKIAKKWYKRFKRG